MWIISWQVFVTFLGWLSDLGDKKVSLNHLDVNFGSCANNKSSLITTNISKLERNFEFLCRMHYGFPWTKRS